MKTTRWPASVRTRDYSSRVRVRGAALLVAWVDFLSCIPWEFFVTLTFDPKRVFPVDCTRAEREAFRWCGQVGYALRRPVGWLIALERHASGQWHAHVLLVGVPPDISALDVTGVSLRREAGPREVRRNKTRRSFGVD